MNSNISLNTIARLLYDEDYHKLPLKCSLNCLKIFETYLNLEKESLCATEPKPLALWISVDKYLPEVKEEVLVKDCNGLVFLARLTQKNTWEKTHNSNEIFAITHWMEIPE